jgi:hypothetical protein
MSHDMAAFLMGLQERPAMREVSAAQLEDGALFRLLPRRSGILYVARRWTGGTYARLAYLTLVELSPAAGTQLAPEKTCYVVAQAAEVLEAQR